MCRSMLLGIILNGIVLHVFKRKRSKSFLSSSSSSSSSTSIIKRKMETKTSMIVRYKRRAEQQYNPENNVDYYNSAPIGSKPNSDTVTERNAKNGNNKQRLPSFISHPNGIVLRVFKRQRSMIQKDQDQRRVCAKQRSPSSSVPSFICHPNGIVLRVLNQKNLEYNHHLVLLLSAYEIVKYQHHHHCHQ